MPCRLSGRRPSPLLLRGFIREELGVQPFPPTPRARLISRPTLHTQPWPELEHLRGERRHVAQVHALVILQGEREVQVQAYVQMKVEVSLS